MQDYELTSRIILAYQALMQNTTSCIGDYYTRRSRFCIVLMTDRDMYLVHTVFYRKRGVQLIMQVNQTKYIDMGRLEIKLTFILPESRISLRLSEATVDYLLNMGLLKCYFHHYPAQDVYTLKYRPILLIRKKTAYFTSNINKRQVENQI